MWNYRHSLMSRLRVLSGGELVSLFQKLGFTVLGQKGSHVKVRRVSVSGEKQTLVFPQHKEIDRGTLRAVYNQARRFCSESELVDFFS